MPPATAPYRDRTHAGQDLARALEGVRARAGHRADLLVLGLPRGGVPVAAEVARALGAELDVIVARKLGAPGHEELGVGAIAPHSRILDRGTLDALGLHPEDLVEVERKERAEMERRLLAYRGDRAAPRIAGRTVILVDDGVATGVTARAALESLRRERPARLVFAAPVGPPEALETLAAYADEVVLARTPRDFRAVGLWYDDFSQTSDDEVLEHLRRHPARVQASAQAGARASAQPSAPQEREVQLDVDRGVVSGTLTVPGSALGLVIFAHGSGSSRFSPRNQHVARVLQQRGLATLLLDLLTPEEEDVDLATREHRFDLPLLARRLVRAARWAREDPSTAGLRLGFFGSSTGGGAALMAAAELGDDAGAVVSRGGRPDLAGDALPLVRAPTLLLVGGRDHGVIELNEEARARMRIAATLHVVPGATHLFEESGALDEVAGRAADWFATHLPRADRDRTAGGSPDAGRDARMQETPPHG